MRIIVNGESYQVEEQLSVTGLLAELKLDARKIALELNLEIVTRSAYCTTVLKEGDTLEIVHLIGGGSSSSGIPSNDYWELAGRRLESRLIIGTGKYKDYEENRWAADAAGAELVTVAVRRVNLTNAEQPVLTDFIDPKKFILVPNTAGCYTGEEAIRTLRLAREVGGWDLVKLEILGDRTTLYPNMPETVRAAELLIREGFDVMVYCSDDPIQAKQLEEIGCCAIMPLGAPIGSGLGIQNPLNIGIIVERATVPVIVDAGVGTASDAAIAMELGCAAVLMNTAIAAARNPVLMAHAMRYGVKSGRAAYLAGRMTKKLYATPSSPLAGLI